MKLNAKGRYAVMALADLTKHSRGKPVSLEDVVVRRVPASGEHAPSPGHEARHAAE